MTAGLVLAVLQHLSLPWCKEGEEPVFERSVILMWGLPLGGMVSLPILGVVYLAAWLLSGPQTFDWPSYTAFTREQGSASRLLWCWLVLVCPLLITNLLVPEFIARWRGAGLLYPTPAQLRRQRLLWTVLASGGCALVAAAVRLLV
jgi:hypothetical protein